MAVSETDAPLSPRGGLWQWATKVRIPRRAIPMSDVAQLCYGIALGLLLPNGVMAIRYMSAHGLAYPGDVAMAVLDTLFQSTLPPALMLICIGLIADWGRKKPE